MGKKTTSNINDAFEPVKRTRPKKKKKPVEWTIVTALDKVLDLAEDSSLSDDFWEIAEPPLAFLREKLGLTNIQIIVVAILVEAGEAKSWKGLAEYLDCRRLTIMTYSEEVEQLVDLGWLMPYGTHDFSGRFQGFKLVYGVVTALRKNETFVPEKLDGFDHQKLISRMELYAERFFDDSNVSYADHCAFFRRLISSNPNLPICCEIMRVKNEHMRMAFILTILDYTRWADSPSEGLTPPTVDNIFPLDYDVDNLRKQLYDNSGELFDLGLIECKCEDGVVNPEIFVLPKRIKDEVLSDFIPSRSQARQPKTTDRDLVGCSTIQEKQMYYNNSEHDLVAKLTSLLMPGNFEGVQKRLEEEGMRKGFACIFYGAPGTGKTETALQLARATGRDILRIEIAGLRDKFVGESEKNIKNVFKRYKALCRNCELKPILLFNEADGIFGRRIENIQHSVDKMDNAIQNIILQEMETLDGILIATTNLTETLDSAFERRFLFKVEFKKPEKAVKAKIWKALLGKHITDDEADRLAGKYDFSGGQIENIARKRTIDYILDGEEVPFEKIESYCDNELLGLKHKNLGFKVV